MVGIKRVRTDPDGSPRTGVGSAEPPRKRRIGSDTSKVELSSILNDLRDEISEKRLDATKRLIKNLSTSSDDFQDRLDYSVSRLLRGVCSGAKAARPGFSIALVEVLRLGFKTELKLISLVEKAVVLTRPDSKASGDEKRNHLIGRRFAFQAILQSGVLEKAPEKEARYLFDSIAELAAEKDWLRSECGAFLHDFISNHDASLLKTNLVSNLLDSWAAKSLLKSPEGIALWLTIKRKCPDAKLPKGIWHHNNPLSSQERSTLTRVLLKNAVESDEGLTGIAKKTSGSRQITPSFAWQVIIRYLNDEDDGRKFAAFWDECVAKPMFSSSSSPERKSLGLQIFTRTIATAPASSLQHVIHANIIHCIIDQRAKSDRYLFEAAKLPLNQLTARAKVEPDAASAIASRLLALVPGNADKLTRTTLESAIAAVCTAELADVVTVVLDLCRAPRVDGTAEAEQKRRLLADILLSIVRTRRAEPSQCFADGEGLNFALAKWLQVLLRGLADLSYAASHDACSPPLSDSTRSMIFRERLISILSHLIDLPLKQAVSAPSFVVEVLHSLKSSLSIEQHTKSKAAVKDARKLVKESAAKLKADDAGHDTTLQAFHLLFALATLQVYHNNDDESISVLEDAVACYKSPRGNDDASTMLVELLLSFVSKPGKLFQTLAKQVFAAFAPEITTEAMQSLIDILSQKESLAGQQELFAQDGEENEGEEAEETNGSEDDIGIDVEDASDVEIVNGNVVRVDDDEAENDDESGTDGDEDSSTAASAASGDEDEEAAFDRKLAEALGTTGMDASYDASDSDMDDEQMAALDTHLASIFHERAKTSSSSRAQKQDNKSARATVLSFKSRVLDLLLVFVRAQPANSLALDLIHPLTALTRTTSDQALARKASSVLEHYFDACKKHKALPVLARPEACFDLLAAVHAEMRHAGAGAKLHAHACSRASLFLARVLVAADPAHWTAINSAYGELQAEWRMQGERSRIHGSVFNDWHNWSMQR